MIHILIIEDEKDKKGRIESAIRSFFSKFDCIIHECTNFSDARKLIFEKKLELIVTDIMLPRRRDDREPIDISDDLIEAILDSKLNSKTVTVAVTQFQDALDRRREKFSHAGIIVVHYEKDAQAWRGALDACLQRVKVQDSYEFIIFCALEKEREGYRSSTASIGTLFTKEGLDCLAINIEGRKGVIIKLARMGVIEAAAVASRAIQTFNPRIVSMSGICAGFESEAPLGTIIVADVCWEHQAGKWKGDDFKLEHYHSPIQARLRSEISQFIEAGNPFFDIKKNQIGDRVIEAQPVVLAPVVSGSAVIASESRRNEIFDQHRKVAGLDMELFGIYRACDLAEDTPLFFGAKTVVDLADESKGNDLQMYGSLISARFTVLLLHKLFSSSD